MWHDALIFLAGAVVFLSGYAWGYAHGRHDRGY